VPIRDNPAPPEQVDKPSINGHAVNDHAVLGLCEILALMFGLPPGEALFRGDPLSLRLVGFIVAGAVFAALGPGWPAVRKSFPQQTLVLSLGRIAADARYWLVIILVGFLYAASPEMYQRATAPAGPTADEIVTATAPIKAKLDAANRQLQEEREKAKPLLSPEGVVSGRQVVNELKDLHAQLDDLKRQNEALRQAAQQQGVSSPPPPPAQSGPIIWNTDGQLFVVGGDAVHSVHGALFRGISTTLVTIKEAYAISGLTGRRQELKANIPNRGYYDADKVDIPPQAAVQLDLVWNPPIPLKDFVDQWGKFHITIAYNGITYEREFDETYVRQKIREQSPDAFGPRVTPRDDK
jgi:hypothetical protein